MSKPTIREVVDDIENIPSAYELAERVEAVLELHVQQHCICGWPEVEDGCPARHSCKHCGTQVLWPCSTIRALEGE